MLSAGLLSPNCMISGIIKAPLDGGTQHKILRWKAELLVSCIASWEKAAPQEAAPRYRGTTHGETVAGSYIRKQNVGRLARLRRLPGDGVVWGTPQVRQRRAAPGHRYLRASGSWVPIITWSIRVWEGNGWGEGWENYPKRNSEF